MKLQNSKDENKEMSKTNSSKEIALGIFLSSKYPIEKEKMGAYSYTIK